MVLVKMRPILALILISVHQLTAEWIFKLRALLVILTLRTGANGVSATASVGVGRMPRSSVADQVVTLQQSSGQIREIALEGGGSATNAVESLKMLRSKIRYYCYSNYAGGAI